MGEAQEGPLSVLLDASPPEFTSCGTRWVFDGYCLTIDALAGLETRCAVTRLACSIIAVGATSGRAMLTGFLGALGCVESPDDVHQD